jgi:predicted nucleic acid-binding protein
MKQYVADTHSLYWYLTASPKLGRGAREVFEQASRGEAEVVIPSIVLAELYYLNEKAGEPLVFKDEMTKLRLAGQFVFTSLDPPHIADFKQDNAIPEMHDRIIAGVARRLNAVCLTRDPEIRSSGLVETCWD